MLPWWGWLLLWGVLVVGGATWIGLRARTTWRIATALTAEVDRAGRLVAEALADPTEPHEDIVAMTPALAQDPREVRELYRRHRVAAAERRRVRRAARRPPWARVD
jgi:hypothetical protein